LISCRYDTKQTLLGGHTFACGPAAIGEEKEEVKGPLSASYQWSHGDYQDSKCFTTTMKDNNDGHGSPAGIA